MKDWIRKKSGTFWIKTGLSVFLFLVISVYAFTQMHQIIYGVQIKANIESYSESTHLSRISGTAKNATYLTLNGREISIDKNGVFTEEVALPSGLSVITFEAKDKFENIIEKTLKIYTVNNKAVAYLTNKRNL